MSDMQIPQGINPYMFKSLEFDFPFIVRDAVEYISPGGDEIIIKLKDGDVVLYETEYNSIRPLPSDSDNMTEKEFTREFGYRMCKIMKHKCMTQQDISDATGIPRVMISNYMNGKHIPSFYKIDKIAKALECSTDDFRYFY